MDMEEEDIATVHMLFQKLGTENFDLESVLKIASDLMKAYTPDYLLWDNRKIGLENDSPFLHENLQIDAKFEKVAIATNNQYIRFDVPVSLKLKKYFNVNKLAVAGVTATALYLLYSHYASPG